MITGNHDCYLRDSSDINSLAPYAQWNNINLVDSIQLVESHGRKFSFVPWGEKIQNIQKSDIVFGHFEINFFKMNTFFICDHGADAILKKSPLVVSGHFHLRDERKYADGTVLYVGNPFQMDFNDAGTSKGYYIMDVTDNSYVFHENKISPVHHNITLSSMVHAGTITAEVKDQIRNNLIKLKIDRRISPDDIDVLLTKMRQYTPQQFVVEYETNFCDYDLDGDRKDLSGIDIEQAMREFIDLMDINNRQEVIDYTLELYKKIRK
jgi:DNA repair exonuclease SbcCD nuclease subunit